MSNSLEELRDKINGAGDLRSVVRTMKSVAAANIGQYEKSVRSLADYNRTVELGLSVCFRKNGAAPILPARDKKVASRVDAIVFGSDQGLVGQFNDVIVDFAIESQGLGGWRACPCTPREHGTASSRHFFAPPFHQRDYSTDRKNSPKRRNSTGVRRNYGASSFL